MYPLPSVNAAFMLTFMLVFIPVSFFFPSFPVLLKLSVGDMLISYRFMTIIRWKMQNRVRHLFRDYIAPLAIITPGSIPMSMVRAVPIIMVKEDI